MFEGKMKNPAANYPSPTLMLKELQYIAENRIQLSYTAMDAVLNFLAPYRHPSNQATVEDSIKAYLKNPIVSDYLMTNQYRRATNQVYIAEVAQFLKDLKNTPDVSISAGKLMKTLRSHNKSLSTTVLCNSLNDLYLLPHADVPSPDHKSKNFEFSRAFSSEVLKILVKKSVDNYWLFRQEYIAGRLSQHTISRLEIKLDMKLLDSERHLLEIIIDRFFPKLWSNSKILPSLEMTQQLSEIYQSALQAGMSCQFPPFVWQTVSKIYTDISHGYPNGILPLTHTLDDLNRLDPQFINCPAVMPALNQMYKVIYMSHNVLHALKTLLQTVEKSGTLESLLEGVRNIEMAAEFPNTSNHFKHAELLEKMNQSILAQNNQAPNVALLTEFYLSHHTLLYEAKYRQLKYWLLTIDESSINARIAHLMNVLDVAENDKGNTHHEAIKTLARQLKTELENNSPETVYPRDNMFELLESIFQQSDDPNEQWKWGTIGEPMGYVSGKSVWKAITDIDNILYKRGHGFDYSIPKSTKIVLDNRESYKTEIPFFKRILKMDSTKVSALNARIEQINTFLSVMRIGENPIPITKP